VAAAEVTPLDDQLFVDEQLPLAVVVDKQLSLAVVVDE
jgi:hypothetical protein